MAKTPKPPRDAEARNRTAAERSGPESGPDPDEEQAQERPVEPSDAWRSTADPDGGAEGAAPQGGEDAAAVDGTDSDADAARETDTGSGAPDMRTEDDNADAGTAPGADAGTDDPFRTDAGPADDPSPAPVAEANPFDEPGDTPESSDAPGGPEAQASADSAATPGWVRDGATDSATGGGPTGPDRNAPGDDAPAPDEGGPPEDGIAEDAAPSRDAADDSRVAMATPAGGRQDPPPAPGKSGPGFFALLMGGAVAAVIGFGAARFVIPEGWPFGPVSQATRDLTAALDTQAERIATLEATVQQRRAEVSEEIADARGAVADEVAQTLDSRLSDLEDRLAARISEVDGAVGSLRDDAAAARATLDERITALERQPADGGGLSDAAVQSYEREVSELRTMLEEERARAAQVAEEARAAAEAAQAEADARAAEARAEAEALAQAAARNRALAEIGAALESGGGFAGALDALEEAGLDVPADLRAAQDGVPTLEALQEGFAAPARAALATLADAEPDPQAGPAERVGDFLRAQFGVRSLAPRAGDDPDAILSRAEDAVGRGDLDSALTELGTLPAPAQDAMADWVARAEARRAATEAAATLAQQ